MYRRKSNSTYNKYNNCNSQGDKLIVLSAIISTIISQEIKSDDELNVIGNLLIAIGSNLALGAAQRSSCNNNIDENNTTDNINNQDITLVDDNISTLRSQENNKRKIKKVKIRKRLKTE